MLGVSVRKEKIYICVCVRVRVRGLGVCITPFFVNAVEDKRRRSGVIVDYATLATQHEQNVDTVSCFSAILF